MASKVARENVRILEAARKTVNSWPAWKRTAEVQAEIDRMRPTAHPPEAAFVMPVADLAEVVAVLGCGDNSCRFAKSRGMSTNGGCRCFEDLPPGVDRVVHRFFVKAMAAAGIARRDP